MIKNAKVLKDASFDEEIQGDMPVVIDCWAEWCGPCKQMAPIIDELAAKYEGKVKIFKASIDDCPDGIREYGVSALPTVLFFKGGKISDKSVGLKTKKELESNIKKLLEE